MTASTGRSDYDQAVKLSTLQPGEPIFVLRGQDRVAGDTIRAWGALAHKDGAPAEAVELALQQADRMDAWPTKKAPDGPDLDENQRKQLRYEHSRRAWAARAVVETEAGALGYQLGQDAVLGQLRPILSDLAMEMVSQAGVSQSLALHRLFALVGQDFGERLRAADE